MKYRVPLRLTFDGYALVNADNEEEAIDIAIRNVGGILDHAENNLSDKVEDWEFDIHSNTILNEDEDIEEMESIIPYREVYNDIQEVKAMIRGLSFEDACKKLYGFNEDGELFDYNYGDFEGTVINDNGLAKISDDCTYGILYPDGSYADECVTEEEIKEYIAEE